MPKTVLEAKPSALYYLKVEVLIDTLEDRLADTSRNLEVETLFDTLTETIREAKA